MPELNEAEKYLLEEIRKGSGDGWSQLVDRYQGRLRAFARSKLRGAADADDLVQDTFIAFLKGLPSFRGEASLETYLFTILRRRIVNAYRGKARHVSLLQDAWPSDVDESAYDPTEQLAARDPTASWYVRRDEDHALQHQALSAALTELIRSLTDSLNFRDLQIIEMLFYCNLRNKDIARCAGVTENHVALIKHRSIKKVQDHLGRDRGLAQATAEPSDALLGEIWRGLRLSCLKRSTVGGYLLGTLDAAWHDYVEFHLETLGCAFCRANLEDLQRETADDSARTVRDRILQSTVGFLRPST